MTEDIQNIDDNTKVTARYTKNTTATEGEGTEIQKISGRLMTFPDGGIAIGYKSEHGLARANITADQILSVTPNCEHCGEETFRDESLENWYCPFCEERL